ncbi:MAG: DUF4876 domain-containing protein [Bacteroidales bacterium]|nr:DUF4876 domain-containing protein [Bacteroidales bacterium]
MKQVVTLILAALCAVSCLSLTGTDNYGATLGELEVALSLEEAYAALPLEGVEVTAGDVNSGASYQAVCDASGTARFTLPDGLYRLSASAQIGEDFFNAARSGIVLNAPGGRTELHLRHSRFGEIVIKELYCGGCRKTPKEGTHQSDKYFILHNNVSETVYLDSLCFGTLSPYNSTATNVWPEGLGYVPVIQCVWQFPGSGKDFPLAPGEDAIVAVNGAVDHAQEYPLSVNLNREDCFVCYNATYFTNKGYHPAPGDKIRTDHILSVVIKTGQANAYPLSVSSPTLVIFRAEGMSIQEFIAREGSVIQVPGSTVDQVVCVPEEWVLDGMEVFDGRSSVNNKRLGPMIDAGFVYQSDTYTGHSLMRRRNEAKSAAAGYEVLQDTNNSTKDFYETEQQSLHD